MPAGFCSEFGGCITIILTRKEFLRPISCSMVARDGSTLDQDGEWWGVGMNLRLSPRREAAAGGSDFCFVRSWNAVLPAFRR